MLYTTKPQIHTKSFNIATYSQLHKQEQHDVKAIRLNVSVALLKVVIVIVNFFRNDTPNKTAGILP